MKLSGTRRGSSHPVARRGTLLETAPVPRRTAALSMQAAQWPPHRACIAAPPANSTPQRQAGAVAAAARPPAQQAQRGNAPQEGQQTPQLPVGEGGATGAAAAAAAALQLPPVTIRAEGGAEWRVRPYDPDVDFWGVADLQSRCFHDKIPFAPLDGIAYNIFRAEVVDGLKSKARCLDPATYTLLVVEAASSSSSSTSSDTAAGASQQQQEDEKGVQQRRTTPGPAWRPPQQQQGQRSNSSIVGIVELGLQEEGENVRLLKGAGVFDQMFDQAANGQSSSSSSSSSGGGSTSTIVADQQPACVYLSSMGVSPEARRGGAARAMLLAAQWQAALWGQRHIALHVYADNSPAVKLYSSAGWAPVGRDPDWKRWLGGRVRAFLVKALPAAAVVEADAATPIAVRVALAGARSVGAADSVNGSTTPPADTAARTATAKSQQAAPAA